MLWIFGFWSISLLWGSIMTVIGLLTAGVLICLGYRPRRYMALIYFEIGENWGGVNLGPVLLVNKNASEHLLKHEAGHGVQNLVYGIFMPVVVSLPSLFRSWWRKWIRRTDKVRYNKLPKYESIWFESQATKWGYRLYERYSLHRHSSEIK